MATSSQRKPNRLESLLAGVVAGAVEGAVTYPAEFVKTKAQFASSSKSSPVSHSTILISDSFLLILWQPQSIGILSILTDTIKHKGVRGLYSGAGALIIGNGLKAGVRFMTYDSIKEVLRDQDVCHVPLIAWKCSVQT